MRHGVRASERVDVADEGDAGDRAQHHPVDRQRGSGRPWHHGDRCAGADDFCGDGELVDAVIDLRGLTDHGSQMGEHTGERESLMGGDPTLLPQLLGSDPGVRRQGVAGVQGDLERFDEKRGHDQACGRPRRVMCETVRDDEVVVCGQTCEPALRDVSVGQGDTRTGAELAEKRAEQGKTGAVECGDGDGSLFVFEEGPDGLSGLGEGLIDACRGGRQRFPGFREHESASLLDGQRHRYAGLQCRELLGHGGRADMRRGCDGRDAAPVPQLAEETQSSRIHKVVLNRRSIHWPLLFRFDSLDSSGMALRMRSEPVVDLLLLGVAAVWGASFLAAKDLAAETGVPAAVALRFLVAAAATWLVCLARRERLPRGRGLVIAACLGCSQAAVIGLETWGVHLTSATNAGLLISLALVMTPVLDGVASRSWLPRAYFVAAVAAVVGVALLVSEGGLRIPTVGDSLVIAAAIVRAIHVTASAHLTRGRTEGTLGVVLVQMVICAAVFTVIAGPELSAAAAQLDAHQWANVLFLGLLCSVFAFIVQLWAVRRTSASRASILMGTEPVWALLVGVLIAGEAIGVLGIAGALLIIAASYAGQAIERRHRQHIADSVRASVVLPRRQ